MQISGQYNYYQIKDLVSGDHGMIDWMSSLY